MYAAESLQRLLNNPFCVCHHTDKFHSHMPGVKALGNSFELQYHLLPLIVEYSKRALSYPSDTFSAFLGFLSFYVQDTFLSKTPVLALP